MPETDAWRAGLQKRAEAHFAEKSSAPKVKLQP